MIYLTGDTHGGADVLKLFNSYNVGQVLKDCTKDDYLIICGDFGFIWDNSPEEIKWQEWLENRPYTILFVDGNHECINSSSDVLTEKGWMNIKDAYQLENLKIANVDMKTHILTYDYPLNKIRKFSEKIIDIEGTNYKQSVTPNHDVIINGKKIKAKDLLHEEIFEKRLRFRIANSDEKIDLSPLEIELLTSIVMDGTIVDYSKKNPNSHKIRIQFHFKKERKIIYVKKLLDELKINYTVRQGKNNDTFICIHGDDGRKLYKELEYKKELPFYFSKMNNEQFDHLLYALEQTDGTVNKNCLIWRTTSLNNINVVQMLCVKFNYDMSVKEMENGSGYTKKCKKQYNCSLGNKELQRKITVTEQDYNDDVYCFTMPKGTLITRYKYCYCVTGNCFDLIEKYPVKEWNGGKVHFIKDSIIHLMRGQVYEIEGKKIFTMGGGTSIDKAWRKEGESWWPQEIPSDEEFNEALKNLDKNNWQVDYVITHEAPNSIHDQAIGLFTRKKHDKLTCFLESLIPDLKFDKWYFGHYHYNRTFGEKENFRLLYDSVVKIGETEPILSEETLKKIEENRKKYGFSTEDLEDE